MYVPRKRVWVLKISGLKYGIHFALFKIVIPVLSLDRVPFLVLPKIALRKRLTKLN